MDCTKCELKGCRKLEPCIDNSEEYIDDYGRVENVEYLRKASLLVDNGRAGKLNRLEEIVEYCRAGNITKNRSCLLFWYGKRGSKIKKLFELMKTLKQ